MRRTTWLTLLASGLVACENPIEPAGPQGSPASKPSLARAPVVSVTDLGTLLAKRAAVHATTLRARPPEEKAAVVASVAEHVWPLVADGAVRPVIDRIYPLEAVADAHRLVEESGHVGKVRSTSQSGRELPRRVSSQRRETRSSSVRSLTRWSVTSIASA